jgi:hypothetical protein
MNFKQNRKWLLTMALAVASATLFTATAQAQQVAGAFTLPCAVRWGVATLPAGHYTFTARSSIDPFLLTVRGRGTNAIIMAVSRNMVAGSRSSLSITRDGNQAVVSSLQLAPYGVSFNYGKRYRRVVEAANRPPGKTGSIPTTALAQATAIEIPIAVSWQ